METTVSSFGIVIPGIKDNVTLATRDAHTDFIVKLMHFPISFKLENSYSRAG